MKIALVNIDSVRIPNLALAKINKFHIDNKDEIVDIEFADKVYVSCVFAINKDKCKPYEQDARCVIGGSGYDIDTKLPEEIEGIKPRINLGFTSRGCIRNCKFCIVPRKEGRVRATNDLMDLWDGKSKNITLLDNNLLALPDHFKLICKQARENKIKVDFNQGLDCRLLTDDMVKDLKEIKPSNLHFAWDDLKYEKDVVKAIDLLQKHGINRCTWLVLTGFNTTFKQDLYRANYLKSRNQVAYIMRYNNSKSKKLVPLSRWVNNRSWFRAVTWEYFVENNYKGREEEYGIKQ